MALMEEATTSSQPGEAMLASLPFATLSTKRTSLSYESNFELYSSKKLIRHQLAEANIDDVFGVNVSQLFLSEYTNESDADAQRYFNHLFDLKNSQTLNDIITWSDYIHTLESSRALEPPRVTQSADTLGSAPVDELKESGVVVQGLQTERNRVCAAIQEYFWVDMALTRKNKERGLLWILKADNVNAMETWLEKHKPTTLPDRFIKLTPLETVEDTEAKESENQVNLTILTAACAYNAEQCLVRLLMQHVELNPESESDNFLLETMIEEAKAAKADNLVEMLENFHINSTSWNPFENSAELLLLKDFENTVQAAPWQKPEPSEDLLRAFENLLSNLQDTISNIFNQEDAFNQLQQFVEGPMKLEQESASELYASVWRKLTSHYSNWDAWLDSIATRVEDLQLPKIAFDQPITHPVQDYWKFYTLQLSFEHFLCEVAAHSGGIPYLPKSKSLQRFAEKCVVQTHCAVAGMRRVRSNIYPPSLWDFVRGTVNYENLFALREGFDFVTKNQHFLVHSVSIRFQKSNALKKDVSKWQDISVYGKFNPSQIDAQTHKIDAETRLAEANSEWLSLLTCEIQLSLKPFTIARADLGGHDLYSQYRFANDIYDIYNFVGKEKQTHLNTVRQKTNSIIYRFRHGDRDQDASEVPRNRKK